MESPIEFIRSIRDTLPTPVSHFGEQVILSIVSKIEDIWRTYVLRIGRHMITVASLSVALVIFIASRFFRQNRIQPPNTPNPTTPDNTTIPITQTDQKPPIIPNPDIPRLRFKPNPIPLPEQTAPPSIQLPDPNAPTIPDPNLPHPPERTNSTQESTLAIIPLSRPTTPKIHVHLPRTKASRVPDIFKHSTQEEREIIKATRSPFDRKISIIISRNRFKFTFIKYGRSEQDEPLHRDQRIQIERVMCQIDQLFLGRFPKKFGPILLPLKTPPRNFEPYCILSAQDLEKSPCLEILPRKDTPTPLSLRPPPFTFDLHQDPQHPLPQNMFDAIFAHGPLQLNSPFSFYPQNPPTNNEQEPSVDNSLAIVPFGHFPMNMPFTFAPQDPQQPRATSPTNNEPNQLSKSTQTDLSFRGIIQTPLDPLGRIYEGTEQSMEEELRKLKEALQKAHTQIDKLLVQISQNEAEIKELETLLEAAKEETQRAYSDFDRLNKVVDELSEKITTTESELMDSRREVKALLEEKKGLLKEHSNRLQREILAHGLTQQKLRESQILVSEKETQLERIKQELTGEKGAHSKTTAELKKYTKEAEARLQELFEENGAISAKNADLAEENAELRLFIANTRQENAALAAKNAELRSSIRNRGEIKKSNPQLTMSQLVEISLEPSEGIKEITEEANQKINKLKNALERANEQIRDLTEQISRDAEEKRKLKGSLEGANAENALLEADIRQQETMINQLEEEKAITEAENTKLTRQIQLLSDQEEENKQFRIQIIHLQAQLAENQSRQQRLEEIQASLTQKEVEIERLRRASTALETTHQALQSEYATYRAASESLLEELQEENSRLYVEKANLHQEMANISRQMATTPRRQMPSTPRLYASQPASSADSPPPYGANPSYPSYTPMRSTTDSMHPTLSASATDTSFTGQEDEEDA